MTGKSKKNRLVMILAIFSVLAVSATAFTLYESDTVEGDVFSVDNIHYVVLTETPERTVKITYAIGFTGTELNLATVTYNQHEYKVTQIGGAAFQDNETLISVSFPNVTDVGTYTFQRCTSLVSADFPELLAVSENMFDGCTSLASVNFPKATDIGSSGFERCGSLISVIFEEVETIGSSAFYECYNLVSVDFPEATSIGNSAFWTSDSIGAPESQLRTIHFPKVKTIGSECFFYSVNLTSLHLPEVISIGNSAFYKNSLKDAYLPKLVTIGYQAFRETNLVYVDLPNVTTVGGHAFNQCFSLTSVNMPVVETIAERAFFSCIKLVSVTFSDFAVIEAGAFNGVSTISLVEIEATSEDPEDAVFLNAIKSQGAAAGGSYITLLIVTEDGGDVSEYATDCCVILVLNGTEYWIEEGAWTSQESSSVVTVTFHASEDEGAETKVVKIMKGSSLSLGPLFLKDGYTQTGWYLDKGDPTSDPGPTYSGAYGDWDLYALYTEDTTYAITATTDTDMGAVTGSGTYYEGTVAKLTAVPNTGYKFIKWTCEDEEFYAPTMYVMVEGVGVYTAVFVKLDPFTVTVQGVLEGGTFSESVGTITGDGTYYDGDNVTLTAVAKDGYKFTGWKSGVDVVSTDNEYVIKSINENKELVAMFIVQHKVTITGELTGGTFSSSVGTWDGDGEYNDGASVTLTAVAKTGYKFTGWKSGATVVSTESPYTFSIEGDVELTAVFVKLAEYTVTVTGELEDGTFSESVGTITGDGTYYDGEKATLTATAKTGYRFVEWVLGTERVSTSVNYTTGPITGNTEFIAVFAELEEYTVTFVSDGTVVKTYQLRHGETITKPAQDPTKPSTVQYVYTFTGWEGFTEGKTITGDVTFNAKFTESLRPYIATFNGYTLPLNFSIDYGLEIEAPSPGPAKAPTSIMKYEFVGWNGFTEGMKIYGDITFEPIFKGIVDIGADDLDDIIENDKIDISDDTADEMEISSETLDNVNSVISSTDNTTDTLSVSVRNGTIELDRKAVDSLNTQMTSDATISIIPVVNSTLPDAMQDVVKDRPVFKVEIGNISQFGDGVLKISLKYTLGEGENASNIVIWCVKTDGSVESFTCTYADGYVTFETSHLSYYCIAYEASSGGDKDNTLLYIGIAAVIIVIVGGLVLYFVRFRK